MIIQKSLKVALYFSALCVAPLCSAAPIIFYPEKIVEVNGEKPPVVLLGQGLGFTIGLLVTQHEGAVLQVIVRYWQKSGRTAVASLKTGTTNLRTTLRKSFLWGTAIKVVAPDLIRRTWRHSLPTRV